MGLSALDKHTFDASVFSPIPANVNQAESNEYFADDQHVAVEHMARLGRDLHGDPEVSDELLPLPSHRLVVRNPHHACLLVCQHMDDELDA